VANTSTKLARRRAVSGAQKLMLQYLEKAEAAARRLHHPDDADALHDVRVALRHVRTYLTTYRKLFAQAITPRSREALRDLTHFTNPARDAEVQAAWFAGQPQTRSDPSGAAARLHARLNERLAELMRQIRERFAHDFPRVSASLRVELGQARDTGRRTFGRATAKQVLRQGQRLRRRLDRVEGMYDVEASHKSRIAAKRVRYLLEPFEDLSGFKQHIQYFKDLQDSLGEMHDLHVLLETLTQESERAQTPEKPSQTSELASLASQARQRLASLYGQAERAWRGFTGARLDAIVAQAASELRKVGRKRP
jgi:CHAD domain-containing protein